MINAFENIKDFKVMYADDKGKFQYTYKYGKNNIENVKVTFLGINNPEETLQQIVESRINIR